MLVDPEKIREAKEKLGEKNADLIAELLQIEKYDARRHVGCCPNPNHQDDTPSFSYDPKLYRYKCFGCGHTVDLVDAIMQTDRCTFLEACEKTFELADITYDFTERGAKSSRQYYYPEPKYADNKDTVYAYWQKRGISPETIDYLGIQQDEQGNTIFQYWDLNDVLVGCKVRPSRVVAKGERKIWHMTDEKGRAFDHTDVLYNINKINTSQPLIITSGEGDCAAAVECGFTNTCSINGGDGNLNWIAECWDFLQEFDEILLVPDNDKSGQEFQKAVSTRLGEYRVKIVCVPKVYTSPEGLKQSLKDLNELLYYAGKEAVCDAIRNAQDSKIEAIVDYSDVKQFDMSDVDGFTSGLAEIDRAIDKFYMGTTNILTGVAGSGKSSWLSTIICKSIEQGFPCFVYSGELSNPSLKNWVDCVHAGQRNIKQYQGQNGYYYKLTPTAYRAINAHYKGKIYFYKDGFDQKASSLLATMEAVVRKYGVKTIVIDNMSSIDLECDDKNKYFKQDEFIRTMINFGKRFDVCIFIVIHPKKLDMLRRMNIFDLQGVVGAVNLSHRVLALYRVQPKEKEGETRRDGKVITSPNPWDVEIEVLKDRFGSGAGKKIGLWYDVPSKRFFDSEETLNHQYAWDETNYGNNPLPYPPPQLAEREEVFGSAC